MVLTLQFLNSPEVPKHVSQKAMDNLLSLGLNSPNWLVRAMSLKGLSSIMMNAQKVRRRWGHLWETPTSTPGGLQGGGQRRATRVGR